ncbi:dienelactone hydrolase family protein [Streptomyces kaniharaensis]|uniref:Dienelactone hydrolase family protein n=1 Tax=Streptomyces kaniharaensis TaxID=212423 RepID=A0A6N7KI19_9ACTN|nr:dienelactone hydrolase family protein [Streptomyces kaniharaensis]MQS10971.1 dienelactone hydrolase family protein [Streptomyces kaniharaensis]
MCYDADAAPPAFTPALRPLAEAAPLTLISADGTEFGAFLASPEFATGPAVLLLPDNKGLSGFYRQTAARLAEQGHPTLVIDYYGRTAGADPEKRPAEFGELPNLLPRLLALTPDGLDADLIAGLDHLRGIGATEVVALGFCFGGRQAFRAAAPRFGLAGAVGFYGYPDTIDGAPGPTQLAPGLTAPILALWGGADEHIPAAAVDAFDAALTAAGCPHEFVTYPRAPHNFFELRAAEPSDAARDAWQRLLGFLSRPH